MRAAGFTSSQQTPEARIWENTRAQMMLKTKPNWSVSISGPGVSPTATKAMSSKAMEVLPGMPKARVVISAPPSLALLDDSGAMTPRTSPWPKPSLFLSVCRACA